MKFKQLKELICSRAKEQHACADEYKRALQSKTKQQLLKVIKDNFAFCYGSVVTVDTLDEFGEDLCIKNGIYYKGVISEIKDQKEIVLCGNVLIKMLDNSTVTEMWGNSTVTEMWGNSTVTKMLDNSTVTEMWGNSTVTKMLDNSTVTEMWGNSTVTEMWGNSTVTEMLDNSTVTKMLDNSTVTKMLDNSTVTKMWGNSAAKSYNGMRPKETSSRFCIIDYKNKKIVCGDEFEIEIIK